MRHIEHTALLQINLCCRRGRAWPRSCSSLPSGTLHPLHHDFLPLDALQDVLGTEQVPAVLHGLAAGQLWWKRQALPQAGGSDPRAFSSPTPSG